MKKLFFLISILASVFVISPALAQEKKCEGPDDLCSQIVDLQKKIDDQKAVIKQNNEEIAIKDTQDAEKAAKLTAAAALMAVILKLILSVLSNWKEYFKTDKGKAWVRLSTLVIGFLAFIATNIGLGIVWWQSLIVAFGGPGAILVHELAKVIPALRGTGKLPPEENDPPADPPANAA